MNQRKKNQGYSLIYVMMLIASISALSVMEFKQNMTKEQELEAANEGKKLKWLNSAINSYIQGSHANALKNMQDNNCFGNTSSCVVSEWFCQPIGLNQCELNLNQLKKEGLIASNWDERTSWNSNYKAIVTRVLKDNASQGNATGMDYQLRAITVSEQPWMQGASVMSGLLSKAVEAGGADLGMTRENPNQAEGLVRRIYNADLTTGTAISWTADTTMNPFLKFSGQLVARAGFESTIESGLTDNLLKKDGSRPMRADLNMNNERINNTQDVFLNKLSGGRNVATITPNWVFKYTWRVNDGDSIPKPDCSAASGGWTNRTSLNNPWDPKYDQASDSNKAYDRGEPRILLVNDYLGNLKSLGYYSDAPSYRTAESSDYSSHMLNNYNIQVGDSRPSGDAYEAFKAKNKVRAKGSYSFFALDNGNDWKVFFRYYQDGTVNTVNDPTMGRGIASVYCFYDDKKESSCNGERGCSNNGISGGGAFNPNIDSESRATTTAATQSYDTAGSTSVNQTAPSNIGARDVSVNF